MIKYICLACGGPNGLINLAIIYYLIENSWFSLDTVTDIFGTSVGGVTAILLSLKIPEKIIKPYLIKRKWEKYANFTPSTLLTSYHNKCVIEPDFIKDFILPLLEYCDLNEQSTLLDLYQKTNITCHLITTDANTETFTEIDLNHITYPDLSIIHACEMTCAIPFIFKPCYINNNYYIDGAFLNGFPINNCIDIAEDTDEILAIENTWTNSPLTKSFTMTDIVGVIFTKLILSLSKPQKQPIKHLIQCNPGIIDISGERVSIWSTCLTHQTTRELLFEKGVIIAQEYITSLN